jgi:hypothetical protein
LCTQRKLAEELSKPRLIDTRPLNENGASYGAGRSNVLTAPRLAQPVIVADTSKSAIHSNRVNVNIANDSLLLYII